MGQTTGSKGRDGVLIPWGMKFTVAEIERIAQKAREMSEDDYYILGEQDLALDVAALCEFILRNKIQAWPAP